MSEQWQMTKLLSGAEVRVRLERGGGPVECIEYFDPDGAEPTDGWVPLTPGDAQHVARLLLNALVYARHGYRNEEEAQAAVDAAARAVLELELDDDATPRPVDLDCPNCGHVVNSSGVVQP